MAMTNTISSAQSPTTTPLGAVLALTFLGSLGTGVVTNGIAFVATHSLGYAKGMNLLLALALGASYIVGALTAGRLVCRYTQKHAWLSTRGSLVIVLALIALACQLPLAIEKIAPNYKPIAFWVLVLIFSPATGILWPIIESYLSGGRSAKTLRQAIGRFNITWSIALVAAFWLMAPLLESNPLTILSALGVMHLLMIAVLPWFPPDPPTPHTPHTPSNHLDEHHEKHPDSYLPLLRTFRILLIASYVVLAVLSPLLPMVETKLNIPIEWQTPIASIWLAARVLLFILFERWHGWHGRWWTPWTGLGLLLVGFATCMLAPSFPPAAMFMLVAGLFVMGIGIATTYCGALYYALAVGSTEIDAGGKHEALIGLGYTLGPLGGLIGLQFAGDNPEAFRLWVIAITAALVLLAVGLAIRTAKSKQPVAQASRL